MSVSITTKSFVVAFFVSTISFTIWSCSLDLVAKWPHKVSFVNNKDNRLKDRKSCYKDFSSITNLVRLIIGNRNVFNSLNSLACSILSGPHGDSDIEKSSNTPFAHRYDKCLIYWDNVRTSVLLCSKSVVVTAENDFTSHVV